MRLALRCYQESMSNVATRADINDMLRTLTIRFAVVTGFAVVVLGVLAFGR